MPRSKTGKIAIPRFKAEIPQLVCKLYNENLNYRGFLGSSGRKLAG